MHEFSVSTLAWMDLIDANRVKDSQVIVSIISLEVNIMVVDMNDYDVILEWIG